MLTERFIASIGAVSKTPSTNATKDGSIFVYEIQPALQLRSVFKKSASLPSCLAVSETHIFAAQAEKGVVHLYDRQKGNQTATVPFTERISALALACEDSILVVGTVEGRIFLWETTSGRQVTTSQAHLQAVTTLAVDPTSNFLLSGSKDATVHVWSIPAILSFANTTGARPLTTFGSHVGEITALVLGRSSSPRNFAISVSRDQTCLVWDYRKGNVLRTFLLPEIPSCLALDPADRSVYVGYQDGSLQQLDLLTTSTGHLDSILNGTDPLQPVKPKHASRWTFPDTSHGPVLSLSVSFDGSTLISGQESGAVLYWDIARKSFITSIDLPGPVNNLHYLPVTGFSSNEILKKTKVNEVIKPKFGAFDHSDNGQIPGDYTLHVQLSGDIDHSDSEFRAALAAPVFPTAWLDEGLSELSTWSRQPFDTKSNDDDFMPLSSGPAEPSLQEENANLVRQLEALRRLQAKSFDKIDKLNEEKRALMKREQKRLMLNGNVSAQSDQRDDISEDQLESSEHSS